MKRILLFLMMALTAMSFYSCSSSVDGDDEPTTPQIRTQLGEIETEGSYIGRDQLVEFKCPQTLADGKSVLWSVDGSPIGSTDNSKDSVIWTATSGQHTVTASVDNITRAEYTVIGEDTVTLDWDNGTSETLTYSAPVSNE